MNALYSILEKLSVYLTFYIVKEKIFLIHFRGRDGEVIKINNQV